MGHGVIGERYRGGTADLANPTIWQRRFHSNGRRAQAFPAPKWT